MAVACLRGIHEVHGRVHKLEPGQSTEEAGAERNDRIETAQELLLLLGTLFETVSHVQRPLMSASAVHVSTQPALCLRALFLRSAAAHVPYVPLYAQTLGLAFCTPNLHYLVCQLAKAARMRGDVAAQLELWMERAIQWLKGRTRKRINADHPEKLMVNRLAFLHAALKLAHDEVSQGGIHEHLVSGGLPASRTLLPDTTNAPNALVDAPLPVEGSGPPCHDQVQAVLHTTQRRRRAASGTIVLPFFSF